jgi:hypothetical protein
VNGGCEQAPGCKGEWVASPAVNGMPTGSTSLLAQRANRLA